MAIHAPFMIVLYTVTSVCRLCTQNRNLCVIHIQYSSMLEKMLAVLFDVGWAFSTYIVMSSNCLFAMLNCLHWSTVVYVYISV